MTDIELVIKMPEELKEALDNAKKENAFNYMQVYNDTIYEAIKNGTPLPKGHGDLIDRKLVLSDDGLCEFHRYDDYVKMRNYLKSIPTIIKSDNGESEEE